ncbi:MAG: sigma-70 family RNA polymerase sigma factor [Verrucomicrobiota bacterium]
MADASTASSSAVSTAQNAAPSAAAEDAVLVQRVQAGEMAAFDQLVSKYRERLYSVVYNLTSNREDANDLTQEAFIRAFRSIRNFKGKSSFFTWLYRIAVNTTITHLKRNRKRRFFSFEQIDEEGPSSTKLETLASRAKTEKPTYMRELQEKLNDALQKLSVKHRTVVVLYEIEGLSHQEIAEITKTSEGTVRSRLHYAKHQLRETLKDYLE